MNTFAMTEKRTYLDRELDAKFETIILELAEIKEQTTKHNGRMQKVERNLLIVGSITATLLTTNGSELLGFVKLVF